LAIPWATGWVKRSGPRPAAYLNILLTFAAFAHGLWLLRQVWGRDPQILNYLWFRVADLDLTLSLEISPLTMGAVVWISGLSLLAQIYALGYLDRDWGLGRFAALMGFFEGGMTGIALSDSLFFSYALLEMLTLSTYLLVGFWYAQPLVVTAARDAFLTKRVGDLLLLMGVVAISNFSGALTFSDLRDWAATASLDPTWAAWMGLALMAGPLGKCAQFPLHLWLDEAMEAPNPASILRNSAVVACGAFVLIKLQPLLALSPVTDGVLVAIGTITALGGSLVALAQIDLKRTFSYSTSAYLGLVFMAVGMQQPDLALELLLMHGLAKALLFMGVGSLIYTTCYPKPDGIGRVAQPYAGHSCRLCGGIPGDGGSAAPRVLLDADPPGAGLQRGAAGPGGGAAAGEWADGSQPGAGVWPGLFGIPSTQNPPGP